MTEDARAREEIEMAAKAPARDYIDEMLEVWVREIPDLDPLAEGIIERIQILAWNFNSALDDTLAQYELDRRAYSLLGKLRKGGPPYRASAGRLATDLRLSTGALTNRLDRMEAAGVIRRLPDPDDRRGTIIEPTQLGLDLWDKAIGAAARREAEATSVLSQSEKTELHDRLRQLMEAFPNWREKKHSLHASDSDD